MKDEYDFSKGERGKFYRPDAVLDKVPERLVKVTITDEYGVVYAMHDIPANETVMEDVNILYIKARNDKVSYLLNDLAAAILKELSKGDE